MENVKLLLSREDSVRIALSGVVNAVNAKQIYQQLHALRAEHPQGRLGIECNELTYISSAGLRTLLMIEQEENPDEQREKVLLTGISEELFGIFELSGFTEIFEVHKMLRKVSVEGCPVIGRGANGVVYRLDDEMIVKVYTEGTPVEDINRERQVSKEALVKGISTAIPFDLVKVDQSFGVVFELLDSQTLSSCLRDNPGDFDMYAQKYVELYQKIHATEVSEGSFPSCKKKFLDYIDACTDWYTEEELEKLRSLVHSIPDRRTLIHGDYHPHNIMLQDGKIVLIDMGDMSFGHPVFDFLATASTQANLPDINPEFAEIHTGMPVEMIRRLWNVLIEACFSDRTPDQIQRIDRQVRLLSKLKVGMAPVVGRGVPMELIQASVDDAKQNLIPYIDELIGTIDW